MKISYLMINYSLLWRDSENCNKKSTIIKTEKNDIFYGIYSSKKNKKKIKKIMSNIRIDKDKAFKKWAPVLENMGVRSEERIDWMSEYAEIHSILENVAYANQGNVMGMGSVSSAQPSSYPGATVGTNWSANGGTVGSGDYGQQLLPVAMKIAAQTIGLDLVSVKPTPGPKIDLMYIDFQYDDNNGNVERPQVFKLGASNIATINAAIRTALTAASIVETVGGIQGGRLWVNISSGATTTTEPGTKTNQVEFLGFSRIDGLPMFRAYTQANTASTGSWTFDTSVNTFPATGAMTTAITTLPGAAPTSLTLDLISALEDQLPGFSSNWYNGHMVAMNRAQDDLNYPGIIAPKVSTKTIAVGTIEISTALKRTEIEDIKANTGMDIVQKMESILVNELSQTISKQIIDKLREMGELNRASAPSQTLTNITAGTIFDFDVDDYLSGLTVPGGETSHAIQRKLITKISNASNFIATEGRVGPAQFLVTNGNLAAALQNIAGYTVNPVKSKLNGQGQLYPVGMIGDIQIYVDPYQKYNTNEIIIGRKNNPDQPGVVFIPYLMAQNISIISEATFAPRMLLRSRYAVGELGWYPQKQYFKLKVYDSKQVLV